MFCSVYVLYICYVLECSSTRSFFVNFFAVDIYSLFPEVIMSSISVRVLGAESAVAWMCGPALTL